MTRYLGTEKQKLLEKLFSLAVAISTINKDFLTPFKLKERKPSNGDSFPQVMIRWIEKASVGGRQEDAGGEGVALNNLTAFSLRDDSVTTSFRNAGLLDSLLS